MVPFGAVINYHFQKRFGRLRSIDIQQIIKEIKQLYIQPILLKYKTISNLKIVELGTGWYPVMPTLLSLLGNECTSFDIRRCVNKARYGYVLKRIFEQIKNFQDMPDLPLDAVRKNYESSIKTDGFDWAYYAPSDTTALPLAENSHDVVVTRLVLQHIPLDILPKVIKETWRILKPGGIAIHRINLHDEYAQDDRDVTAINCLKYPSRIWNNFINNRIKHVNQERYPYYLNLFQEAGFKILEQRTKIDKKAFELLSTINIAKEFRKYTSEELVTTGLYVVLEK